MRLMGFVALVVLVLAGCGSPPTEQAGGPGPVVDPLRGKKFLLSEATVGGEPRALVAGTEVSLEFTDDGRLLANAGCNHLSGRYEVVDGRLSLDGIVMTDMGCDPPRHEQDQWLADFLDGGPSFRTEGTTLTLRTADTELMLRDREVADPDRALVGTVWTVDTLIDGQVASTPSTTMGVPPATVTFEPDRANVFTGCNSGSATYQVSGDMITFGELVLTRKACEPEIMSQEAAVVSVLDGEVTFGVEADILTLNHPSGKGLQLRAK